MATDTANADHPAPSPAFGPLEAADATRQAQQSRSNDSPTDVNNNAVLARSQALTIDLLGKGFAAAQERRQILADGAVASLRPTA